MRNLLAKPAKSEQDRIRFNYWSALTDTTSVKDGKLRLQVLIWELEHAGYESAARCLSTTSTPSSCTCVPPQTPRTVANNEPPRTLARGGPPAHQSDGPFPGETNCLSLVSAVLDLFFSHASNGATFTDVDRQHLYRIRYQQADPDTLDEEVTAA